MANIIVKEYQHFNRAMGKFITSKNHYEQEMAKGGYVPYEKAEQMAEIARENSKKKYDGLSAKTMKFFGEVKQMADRKGNIKVSQRYIQGLKDHGVRVDCQYDKLPKSYRVDQGGFENA
jgi:hypothetical protein